VTIDRTAHDDAQPAAAIGIEEWLAQGDVDQAVAYARLLHGADLASVLTGLRSQPRQQLLQHLAPHELASIIAHLEPRLRGAVYEGRSPMELSQLAAELPDDLAADLVQWLPEEMARTVVAALSLPVRSLVLALAAYPPDTAAGRMTGQAFAVSPSNTATHTIQAFRARRPEAHRPFYVYVVDPERRLVGIVGLHALLVANPETRIAELMTEAASVLAETDQEEAARFLKLHNLLALPVVDRDGRLLGTLTVDDTVDVLEEEATEDMLRLVGVSEEETLEGVLDSVRFRLPWLTVNLVALLLAAWMISRFETTIATVAVIAVFLPVVLGQGGNGGLQTVTVVVRSLALGRITPRNSLRVLANEMAAALLMGGVMGASVGALAWAWQGSLWLGLVVGLAILGNQLVGSVAGVCFPMGLERMRQDPAVSAPIWVTNATDVLGALLLLGTATLLISRL